MAKEIPAFTFSLDNAKATIRTTLQGFWFSNDAKLFNDQLCALVRQARIDFGRLKIVVDAVDLEIQTQENSAFLVEQNPFQPGDRIAVILPSTLAKLAARRAMSGFDDAVVREVFVSREAAETWLHTQG